MNRFSTPAVIALVAGLALAGCNKSPKEAQADAVRNNADAMANQVDKQADAVEKQGDATAAAATDAAGNQADAMHNQADIMKDNAEKKADDIEAGKATSTTAPDSRSGAGSAGTRQDVPPPLAIGFGHRAGQRAKCRP